MEKMVVKKYWDDKLVEEKIKDLTKKVMVLEHGFTEFEKDYMEKDYNDPNLNIWYIENENNVIATMMLLLVEDGLAKIENVCCQSEFRGMGLAQTLFDNVIEYANNNRIKKIVLGTYDLLGRAIKFYEKNGFKENISLREENGARFFEKNL